MSVILRVFLAPPVALYLGAAFATWTLNPGHWPEGLRFGVAVATLVVWFVMWLVLNDTEEPS